MKITIIPIIIFVDEKYSWRFILKMSVNALSIYGNYLLLLKAILRSSQYVSIQYILSFILSRRNNNVSNSIICSKFAFFFFFSFIRDRNISVRRKYLIGYKFQDNEKILNPSICRILSRLLREILISYFSIYFWSNVFTRL